MAQAGTSVEIYQQTPSRNEWPSLRAQFYFDILIKGPRVVDPECPMHYGEVEQSSSMPLLCREPTLVDPCRKLKTRPVIAPHPYQRARFASYQQSDLCLGNANSNRRREVTSRIRSDCLCVRQVLFPL